jgi:CheY-like chemotaxis protein
MVTKGQGDIGLPTTVLVVEDEVLIRWVIADQLRDCGFRVIEAGSGDEAIDVLRKTALTINVVFSDVQMPGAVNGFALALWVRQQRPTIKVVLTSGYVKATEAAQALCSEVPMLSKPYSPRELERRIELLLTDSGSETPPPADANGVDKVAVRTAK